MDAISPSQKQQAITYVVASIGLPETRARVLVDAVLAAFARIKSEEHSGSISTEKIKGSTERQR